MSDYEPFGSELVNRTWTRNGGGTEYRYGFNGKENDDEVLSDAKFQDYGMRLYRPDLGRFVSVDPLWSSFAWWTPYQFAGNTPIQAIDLDGLETLICRNQATATLHTHVYILVADKDILNNSMEQFITEYAVPLKQEFEKRLSGVDESGRYVSAEFEYTILRGDNQEDLTTFGEMSQSANTITVRQGFKNSDDDGTCTMHGGVTYTDMPVGTGASIIYSELTCKDEYSGNQLQYMKATLTEMIRSTMHELGHQLGLLHPWGKENQELVPKDKVEVNVMDSAENPRRAFAIKAKPLGSEWTNLQRQFVYNNVPRGKVGTPEKLKSLPLPTSVKSQNKA